jgi:hypothetical protein
MYDVLLCLKSSFPKVLGSICVSHKQSWVHRCIWEFIIDFVTSELHTCTNNVPVTELSQHDQNKPSPSRLARAPSFLYIKESANTKLLGHHDVTA